MDKEVLSENEILDKVKELFKKYYGLNVDVSIKDYKIVVTDKNISGVKNYVLFIANVRAVPDMGWVDLEYCVDNIPRKEYGYDVSFDIWDMMVDLYKSKNVIGERKGW